MSGSAIDGRRRLRRLGLLAPLTALPAVMFGASVSAGQEDMVTLCHATGSESNPYEEITVDAAGAYNGHIDAPNHQDGEDIIPPFEFEGQTYSQNWDEEGMAILENGCMVPGSTTTAAPTTALPPTTATPTTAPATTMAPPTTSAGSTTTTGGSTTTPTTTDGPTTTAGPTTTRPSTLPATGGGPDSNVIGAAVLFVLGGGIALAAARRRTT